MTRNLFVSAAFAGLLGAGVLAATTSPAAAYTTRHCDAYGCYLVHCDWDGDNCYRVGGGGYYHRYYSGPSSYYGYYRGNDWVPYDRDDHQRRWICSADGDNCHWVYESY